ncbi:MAG: metal ABC transporter permease [Opitutales bacterium]|nr:metal ABC transporter permease [Opitutales bacterium]
MKIISKLFLVILLSGFQAFHASGAYVGIEDSETLILQTSDKKSAMDELLNVLLLRSYNTRLVILSTTTLGTAAGIVGAFLLLRKRSLMGDALAHSTLPGIAIAFIIMVSFGGSGKSLAGLIAGATLTGVLGLLIMLAIRNTTRLRDDVAMGMVLSVSFGVGLAILGVIQNMPQASAAGLESFIYGKTASMVMADFMTIMVVALVCSLAAILMFKELALLCFDDRFAVAEGFPALRLDILLLVLVTTVTVIGLQSVGLILIIAFLITPPSAARFWTEKLPTMTFLSAVIGAISGWLGASISALVPKMPAGAVIVVVASSIFLFSMLSAPKRGVVARWIRYKDLKKKVERQHVLRAAFELVEEQKNGDSIVSNYPFPLQKLLAKRTWKAPKLNRILNHEQSIGHLERRADGMLQLSESGFGEAARITRNHRLWEIYLVTHADIAPSHVDRDADMVEHILEADMVHRLEEELRNSGAWIPSPHELSTRTQAS